LVSGYYESAPLKFIEVLPDSHGCYIERDGKLPSILRSVVLEPLQERSPRSRFGRFVARSSRHAPL